MKEIYNRKYIAKAVKLSSYYPVIGIIGARQVGKTTLCKMLQSHLKKELVFLDLELQSDYQKLENPEIYLSRFKKKCIVIDEVQLLPNLFPVLRALVDKSNENCQFIVTGSASPDLLKQSTESLAGRIAYIEINPFSKEELPAHINMEQHWFRGGFPRALFAPDDYFAHNWLENFTKTYIERDLRLLGLQTEPLLLRRLWSMLANMHGNIINYSAIASSLGIAVNTVKTYINFFEHAFLVKRLQPYFVNIKKRLVKSPKIFIADSGILHYLLNINSPDILYGNSILGNSWEGYCIQQILLATDNKYEASFFRTHDGAECDLILTKGQHVKYAIEIKYSDSPKLTRGNSEAFNKINARQNIVIIPRGKSYPLKKNIEVFGLDSFLSFLAKDK